MRIVLIGAGYVGLTTATCLAQSGHRVCCYDIDAARIARLARSEIPIYEPGLEEALRRALGRRRLRFTSCLDAEVANAEIVLVAVGTPSRPDGSIDLSQVQSACEQIAKKLRPGTLVVIKSTVTAGTCRMLAKLIAAARQSSDVSVASNPEFLREGTALHDFMNPDRLVIGADDARSAAMLKRLYDPFLQRGVPLVCTSTINAELIKHAANAFLALKVGFINEVADLCEQADGDIVPVARGIGLDPRIGSSFLSPGPGFGGSCFPKDTRAFAATGRQLGASQRLIEVLISRNEHRKTMLARRVIAEAGLTRGNAVAILGLAFKANTGDVRDSAALTMTPILQQAGISVRAHDPQAMINARSLLPQVQYCDCPYEASRGTDALVLLADWPDYKALDFSRLAQVMTGLTVFDFRNLLRARTVVKHGFKYVSIGRAAATRPSSTTGAAPVPLWEQELAADRPA